MVQNIPPMGFYPYNYGQQSTFGFQNNYGPANYFGNPSFSGPASFNDDFMFNATFGHNNAQIQQMYPQPTIETPTEEQPKKKKGIFKTILTGAALIGGAILLKKNWSAVSKWAKGLFNKGGKKAADAGEALVKKNDETAQIIKNIDVKHTNANTRNAVEEATKNTVTRAEQEAYNKANAYQKPTRRQERAMRRLRERNAEQRAELNAIKHNSKGSDLGTVRTAIQAESSAAKALTNGPVRHANGNIYHIENGVVTKVELFQRNKAGELVKNSVELTDPTKIAKHMANMAKQGVKMSDFIPQGAINVAA